MKALAVRVAERLAGWTVRGATLAAGGALETALDGLDAPLVYPFFMADGWFTRINLPQRLMRAGAGSARCLAAFGTDPVLPALLSRAALDGAAVAGLRPQDTALLLAAHGSRRCQGSDATTWAAVRRLQTLTPFRTVTAGFVEQAPDLDDAARDLGPALCLPFFSLQAGHVLDDVPLALEAAGFAGPLLPPIGLHSSVPGLIAMALAKAIQKEPA